MADEITPQAARAAGNGHITGNGNVQLQPVRGMVKIPVRRRKEDGKSRDYFFESSFIQTTC